MVQKVGLIGLVLAVSLVSTAAFEANAKGKKKLAVATFNISDLTKDTPKDKRKSLVEAIKKVAKVKNVVAAPKKSRITVRHDGANIEAIKVAIEDAGFTLGEESAHWFPDWDDDEGEEEEEEDGEDPELA